MIQNYNLKYSSKQLTNDSNKYVNTDIMNEKINVLPNNKFNTQFLTLLPEITQCIIHLINVEIKIITFYICKNFNKNYDKSLDLGIQIFGNKLNFLKNFIGI